MCVVGSGSCSCSCHIFPGVKHFMPCCDRTYELDERLDWGGQPLLVQPTDDPLGEVLFPVLAEPIDQASSAPDPKAR